MKNFSDYLEVVKNSRTLLSEEAVLKNEMITFFEENEIIYDEELLENMRDLVFVMEGIDLKEKIEKAKELLKGGIEKVKAFLGDKRVQAIGFLILALVLINAGNTEEAKAVVAKCNTMCGAKTLNWDTILAQAKSIPSNVLSDFKDFGLPDAIQTFKDGGSVVLKNILKKAGESIPTLTKTLSAMSGLFGIKKGIESAD
jgi:hypothetical protein